MIGQAIYFGAPVKIGRCRNCPHIHHNGSMCGKVKYNVLGNKDCICNHWEPLENLDYLEYLYEKNNKNESYS